MSKRKMGPQAKMASGMYDLHRRNTQTWMPYLHERIATLQGNIEAQKLESFQPGSQPAEEK